MTNKLIQLIAILLIVALCQFGYAQQAPPQQTPGAGPAAQLPNGQVVNLQAPPPQRKMLVRIKDITSVDGDRNEFVMGTGLVVGLSGTGGKATQTRTMAQNLFRRQGIQLTKVETGNLSAVSVTGKIPAYARKGETIQVDVSVLDDASSLRGGTLFQAVLRGIDGQVYAIASGTVNAGGIAAGGQGAGVQKDHPTVGVCEAIVEREICNDQMKPREFLRLILLNKDYSTSVGIANILNEKFPYSARSIDPGTVEIRVPKSYQTRLPDFIAMIGLLRVSVDQPARVVINQKTGTIVIGQHVQISKVVFGNDDLVITTAENPDVSQPLPFSRGETAVLPRTTVNVFETGGRYNSLNEGITVGELGTALNTLGISPSAMINIFKSLKSHGSLQAELIFE